MSAPDDVIAYRLEEAGFTRDQVRALLTAMRSEAATKSDLNDQTNDLRSEIERTANDLRSEIERTANELRSEIERTANDLRSEIERMANELRAEIESTANDLRSDMKDMEFRLRTEMNARFSSMKVWFVATAFTQFLATLGALIAVLALAP